MGKLRKLLALSGEERRLLLTAAFLVAAVRAATWLLPFPAVRRLLAPLRRPAGGPQPAGLSAERIGWAVDVAGKRVPGGRNCLVQALAAQVLLDRRRRPAHLRIGLAKGHRGELEAHAWVESEGKVVIGDGDVSRFVVLPALEAEAS